MPAEYRPSSPYFLDIRRRPGESDKELAQRITDMTDDVIGGADLALHRNRGEAAAFVERELAVGLDGAAMLQLRDGFAGLLETICRGSRTAKEELIANTSWKHCSENKAARVIGALLRHLPSASCIGWEWAIHEAAIDGAASFAGVPLTAEHLPAQSELWVFPGTLRPEAEKLRFFELPDDSELNWQLIGPSLGIKNVDAVNSYIKEGFVPETDLSGRMGLVWVGCYVHPEKAMPMFRALPTIWEGEGIGAYSPIVAALRFKSLPFVGLESAPMSRQQRRQYERRHRQLPAVYIVTLRKKQFVSGPTDGQGGVDWSCRWLVHGHWRKRAERLGPGEPIYVRPHLKGPENKPFRAPRERVYRVRR